MSSTFLTLRYIAFALFISFHSVICVVATLNLGSLAQDTARFPEVDSYLIVMGALGIVNVFSVIFIELIRKNAFIARVIVEIAWVGVLWILNLSGAAAITAIQPTLQCSAISQEPNISCISTKVLLAFTWLSSITLLSYLLGLVVCAVHHSETDSHVWRSGVRDYRWFTQRRPLQDTAEKNISYGRLVDPKEPEPTAIYAQQMGLARNYSIEPLRIETTVERPVPPVPVAFYGSQAIPFGRDTFRFPAPAPVPTSSTQSYSLYPQHLQATVGNASVIATGAGEPPPGGSWPRLNPQEPLRRKERPSQRVADESSLIGPLATVSALANPEMAEQGAQSDPLSTGVRSRPSGPRKPSASLRPRPPPLDLSRLSSRNELGR